MMADGEAVERWTLIGGLLDCLLTIPVALVVMLCMLQDKRRPLWPVWLAMVPMVIMMGVNIANRSDALLPWMQGYILLAVIGFTVYMVREVRQYGRWLRDNYADLEHKEVWQSLLVLAVIMFLIVYYVTCYGSITYQYIIQASDLLLIGHLLWRVETLQDLNLPISSENIVVADATPIDDSDAMDTMIATEETEEASRSSICSTTSPSRSWRRPWAPTAPTSACISRVRAPPTTAISTTCASVISSVSTARP